MIGAAGIILAGGQARRMGGGDKGLLLVGGRPLLARVIDRLRPQVEALALNANGPAGRFADFALPVIADVMPDQPGPLAGILSGLEWARSQGFDWIVSTAADTPLVPRDLRQQLSQAVKAGAPLAIAASNDRVHPTAGLWPVSLASSIRHALAAKQRGLWAFAQKSGAVMVEWPALPHDPFFNVNTPVDIARLEEMLAG